MNLVLIGYRGTGKSTVAARLGEMLGLRVVATDEEVIARAGMPIPDIVERHGWEHFRQLETDVCEGLRDQDRLVIDTGGGAVLRDANVDALKAHGMLVWLTAAVPTIAARIGEDTQRPSLTGTKTFLEEIEDILTERTPRYRAVSDHAVSTDDRSIDQIATDIVSLLPVS